MIIQTQMLRGKARCVMQQEICEVVEAAAIESDAKRRKQLHREADEISEDSKHFQLHSPSSHLPLQDANDMISLPLGRFISHPYFLENNAEWSETEQTDKSEKTTDELESFEVDIFAPSCMCGWPVASCTCTSNYDV